ncbi:MAG: DNA primase family protein [Vulcanimicrobiaceae bacterium]
MRGIERASHAMTLSPIHPSTHDTSLSAARKITDAPARQRIGTSESSESSSALRWAVLQLADRAHPIAVEILDAQADSVVYRWCGTHWAAQSAQDLAAQALQWLKGADRKKGHDTHAQLCAKTLLLLARGEAQRLPDTGRRVVIGTRSHDIEVDVDGTIRTTVHDPAHGITALVAADLDGNRIDAQGRYSPCEPDDSTLWGRYLATVMPDAEVRGVLQEAIGSTLLRVALEKIIVFWGDGANGKSTLLQVLMSLHAGSHTGLSMSQLRGAFGLETLIGKSLATITEAESYLDDATIQTLKSLASRDPMLVNRKHQRAISFVPCVTVVIATNSPLRFSDRTYGALRKFLTIPFAAKIEAADRIADFHARLVGDPREMAAVLDWALIGVQRLIARGLRWGDEPEAIRKLADEQRLETDAVYAWARAVGAAVNGMQRVDKAAVYRDFERWCQDNGHKPHAAASFWRSLRAIVCPRGVALIEERGPVGADGKRGRLVGLAVEGIQATRVATDVAGFQEARGACTLAANVPMPMHADSI